MLASNCPIAMVDAWTLFPTPSVRRHAYAGFARVDPDRLLLTFTSGTAPRGNDGAVMLATSTDQGRTWDEPRPLFAIPGFECFPMGGLCPISPSHLRLLVARTRFEPHLGGRQPFDQWRSAYTDSRDGGRTWSPIVDDFGLFPCWTETYGASNPLPTTDGRLLWMASGTLARDEGWRVGVSFTDLEGNGYTEPIIIAAASGRNYSDGDIVRLSDSRLLAVVREQVTLGLERSLSADEGRTWTPVQPTGLLGANVKLHRLRSGAILMLYRSERPGAPGVLCALSDDAGATWQGCGSLYAPDPSTPHRPGSLCGYPDLIALDGDHLAAVLHTYPGPDGNVNLQFFHLQDVT
jgi:hypothetical protein